MLKRLRTSIISLVLLIVIIFSMGCSFTFFSSEQQKVEKMMLQHEKEKVKSREVLKKQHYDNQSVRTTNELKLLHKKAKRINKKRRSEKFFLWRWLGV